MLVTMAVGDAYGMAHEYAPQWFVTKYNDGKTYRRHQKHKIEPGRYTDDTQMAIAVTEALLSGERLNARHFTEHFVLAFKRDEREGYAGGFYRFLKGIKDADEFLDKIEPDSAKSGGAMRAPPIGLLPNISDVIKVAALQASITHNTEGGRNAAVAAALIVHYAYYRLGPKDQLLHYLETQMQDKFWGQPYTDKVEAPGWMHVRAAATALHSSFGMTELLKKCIAVTGDVDTVAAIALYAGSLFEDIDQDLDPQLYKGLESGTYGLDYLKELDRKMLEKYPRPAVISEMPATV